MKKRWSVEKGLAELAPPGDLFTDMEGGAPRRLRQPEVVRDACHHPPSARTAFTIIELVSVLAIIVVLLSIALGSYSGWTRATGIDAAANLTAAILGQARELAITQRVDAQVVCGNFTPLGRSSCGMVSVYTNYPVLAMPTNTLPAGVCFSNVTPQSIVFLPDGTCSNDPTIFTYNGCAQFVLVNTDPHPLTPRVVEVNPFSGRIRVHWRNAP